MASFFYILTYQVELDDYVFFTSVELLNKSLKFIFGNFVHFFFFFKDILFVQ